MQTNWIGSSWKLAQILIPKSFKFLQREDALNLPFPSLRLEPKLAIEGCSNALLTPLQLNKDQCVLNKIGNFWSENLTNNGPKIDQKGT